MSRRPPSLRLRALCVAAAGASLTGAAVFFACGAPFDVGSAWRLGAAVGVWVVTVGATGWVSWRRARAVALDLREATTRLEAAAAGDTRALWSEGGARSMEGRELRAALHSLLERARQLARREREAVRAVEQVQSLKVNFVASMGHDLRAPLSSILGFAELMALGTDGPLTEAQQQSLAHIQRSTQDLLALLDDMLEWARLDAGRLKLRPAWTPSVEILTEAVSRGRQLIGDRDLRIEAELQPGLPPVHADASRAVQAVVGLLRHAVGAMQQGTVRLSAYVGHGPPGPPYHLRVDVIESGAGLHPADRERIFEAFREIVEPSGRRVGGLGLGLAVARGLMRAHRGDAWCEIYREKGTVLTVALPLRRHSESMRIREATPAPRTRGDAR